MLRSRHRKMCFVVVLVLLSMAWSTIAVNTEGKMLNIFKLSLNDSKNLLGDWSIDLFSPCGIWSYIRCDNVNEHVVSITLANMGFSGTISPSIGNLKFLTYLTLEGNNLTGGIPPELGNMSSLQNLNLANNDLTRDIPSSLGKLSKLKYLTLRNNNLSGGIPHSLSALQNLIELDLSNNNLKGEIPESLFEVHKYDFTGNLFNCSNFPHKHTCASVSSSKSGSSKTLKTGILAGSIGGIVIILAAVLVFLLFWGRHQEVFVDVSGEDDRKIGFGQLKRFSWRELELATDNFSEKSVLGQGGFGKVYKGVLRDNTRVAVKRMTDYHSHGGEAAFLREVEMISVAVHRNLLRLIGFCVAPSERLLVYPYMQNLSVAHRLRELKPGEFFLDWHTRKRIALGAACGLEYLHEHCNPKIIHRDVKAANVLLDENFEAIVGDFGLAKLVDTRKTHVSTQVRGTIGHIAPEYLSTGRSSERTDVFGYGITLLELVTGQRAIDFSRQREDDVLLLDHVKKLEREKCLDAIVDENLKQNYDARELEAIVQVALLCTQISPEGRPTMSEVVRLLEGDGLEERWKEWQQAEAIRHQEIEMMPRRFEWAENSISSQSAVELSGGR